MKKRRRQKPDTHVRHIHPPDDAYAHTDTPWCPCRPVKRGHTVYVHKPVGDREP